MSAVVLIAGKSKQKLVAVESQNIVNFLQELPLSILEGRKIKEKSDLDRLLKNDTVYNSLFKVDGVLQLISKKTTLTDTDSQPNVTITLQNFRWRINTNGQETIIYPTQVMRRFLKGSMNAN